MEWPVPWNLPSAGSELRTWGFQFAQSTAWLRVLLVSASSCEYITAELKLKRLSIIFLDLRRSAVANLLRFILNRIIHTQSHGPRITYSIASFSHYILNRINLALHTQSHQSRITYSIASISHYILCRNLVFLTCCNYQSMKWYFWHVVTTKV